MHRFVVFVYFLGYRLLRNTCQCVICVILLFIYVPENIVVLFNSFDQDYLMKQVADLQ
jgi:hypothetical protein